MQLGRAYVEREAELDQSFAQRRIDAARLTELTAAIARLRGELRNVHLQAHLQTTAVLNDEQIRDYDVHRVYSTAVHDAPHHEE